MAFSATLAARDIVGPQRQYQALIARRLEATALLATDDAAQIGKREIRAAMGGARLGGLARAVDATSDLRKGRVHRRAGGGFSASGVVFVRSRSERTLGAIESYTQGADIRPVKGRWLWIPTPEAPRVVGSRSERERLTPASYVAKGLDRKLGPLVPIRGINGRPMLAVRNVGTSLTGQKRGIRSLTKRGGPRKGDRGRELVVLFVAIPYTARASRVNVPAIMRGVQQRLPSLFYRALERTF